ncbi:glycosyltransferase 87 family protein [Streptomyces marispadix]|uniref:Glycosyltransferase 87 family protein n=1 Tax=Streptomyces marispadix TaxID=2922868 RepID=A0ABS9SVE1_9ACTN|nr:glycosyltransferase 87 family protein [Streptomyces marispadix]MCH6160244.1 glycosyltransferase 87 family protein [Streptomyces marispadix]
MSVLPQSAQSRSRGRSAPLARVLDRPVLIASGVCLLSFAAFWTAQRATGVSMIDIMVYRAEGWTVRTGGDLYAMRATYADLPTTYPPFAALLFTPLTLLDVADMRTLGTAGNLVLLVTVVHLSLRLIGRMPRPSLAPYRSRTSRPAWLFRLSVLPRPAAALLVSSVAVWCEPLWTTLRYGQINLLLTALVLWDLSRRHGHRFSGAGIGAAAGIKLTPALFAVFLALCGTVRAVRRRRAGRHAGTGGGVRNHELRQSAVAAGTFACTVLLGALVLPRDSRRFWFDVLFRSERVGHAEITDNQSLRGVVARLLHTGEPGWPWLVFAVLVAVTGLAVAAAAASADRRRLPYAPAWAALVCAVTALLISPVSWSHHWVWCVPLVLLLGAEALARQRPLPWAASAAAAALLFCSYALWLVPHGATGPVKPELHQTGGQMVLSALYPAAGLGFLALAAVTAVRALRTPSPQATDGANGADRPHMARIARPNRAASEAD